MEKPLESEIEATTIEGKEADRILDLLFNPPKDDERTRILKEVRDKFPSPNQPTELDIDLADE
jgi:streptomycin 6-kinase